MNAIIIGTFTCIVLAIIILWLVAQSITRPIINVSDTLNSVALGDLKKPQIINADNELGTMTRALQAMVEGLTDKTDQAVAIAGGNLTRSLTLNSPNDTLGKALLTMNQELNVTFQRIKESSSIIGDGSSDMENRSKDLSAGATEQSLSNR